MIPEEKFEEFRKFLKESKKTLFLHDDDPDGLSSYLVLRKFAGGGKGLRYSHSPSDRDNTVLKKVLDYDPDLLVLLDIPLIEQDFVDQLFCPVLHLDHHPPIKVKHKNYHYYNPRVYDDKDSRPTSYWAYLIGQESFWIAMAGMIADWHVPKDLLPKFKKEYPGFLPRKITSPGDVYFNSKIGEISKVLTFCMKGSRKKVHDCIKAMQDIESPHEILEQQTPSGKLVYDYYKQNYKGYEELLQDAIQMHDEYHKDSKDKLFIYSYSPVRSSYSSLLSTELTYRLKDKVVIVARVKQGEMIMSLRSRDISIPDKLKKALQGLRGYGGGHKHACGGGINKDDYPIFIDRMKQLILEDLDNQ